MITTLHLLVGLFSGVITYYLTNLFFKPILQYKEVKSEINFCLIYTNKRLLGRDLLIGISSHETDYTLPQRLKELSAKLIAAYYNLPLLYKKYLNWVGEGYSEASVVLARMSDMHAEQWQGPANLVRKLLHLKRTDSVLISKFLSYFGKLKEGKGDD